MEKLCKKVPLLLASLIYPFPHAPPYLWPTASTVCNFYANFFLQETNAEKRERVKERKGAKKWFFEIPPPLPLPSLAFLPFDHSIFASTRLLFFHTIPPSLPPSLVLIFLEGRFTRWNSSLVREGGLRREPPLFFTRRCTKKEGQ